MISEMQSNLDVAVGKDSGGGGGKVKLHSVTKESPHYSPEGPVQPFPQ